MKATQRSWTLVILSAVQFLILLACIVIGLTLAAALRFGIVELDTNFLDFMDYRSDLLEE